jgi:hypothetical protein
MRIATSAPAIAASIVWTAFAEVYRNRLAGAVIIDPSNPFLWHDDGVMTIKDAPY